MYISESKILGGNYIGDKGLKVLSTHLAKIRYLEILNLSKNSIYQ